MKLNMQRCLGVSIGSLEKNRRCALLSFVPPSNSLISVSDPWRIFGADTASFKGLRLPRALLPELQRIKDIVRCAGLGPEFPGQHQEQLTQTLICAIIQDALVFVVPLIQFN